MRIHWPLGMTAILVAAVGATAATHHAPMKAKASTNAKQIAAGKALISKDQCNGCHSADLKGKPGFSPSIRWSSLSKTYNEKTFARVMDTGVTQSGSMVKKPMPVYHLKAAESAALVAYLKTQK
ncbi:hypothetical protein CCAX7_48320 [Capsulimonas corticalis]|uniref:Uncharacterized protein n=1 Tax=Capsulimonas corticalis TaxID=2219043 RepID=A0A402CQ85_9BACT|nr:cytochrome c [Capsulimonas corticalis]BDI32781.1 hypothetical protein CCAX7_48320 [Capsulimonas corticalis]